MAAPYNTWLRSNQLKKGQYQMPGPGTAIVTSGSRPRTRQTNNAPVFGMSPEAIAQSLGIPISTPGAGTAPGGQTFGFNTAGASSGGGTTVPRGTAPLGAAQGAGSFNNDLDFQTANATGARSAAGSSSVGGTTHGTDTAGFTFQGSDKAYSPGDVSAFLQNPQLFQAEYLSNLGINNPTAQGAMGQFYQALPALAEFFAARSAGADASMEDETARIMEELLTQYTTPGGRTPDAAEILNTLLGIGQVGNDGLATNALQGMYAGTSPENQMQMVQNLWDAAIGGNPTSYGDMMSEQMQRAQLAYQQSLMNANNGSVTNNVPNMTFVEFLRSNPLFRRLAGM